MQVWNNIANEVEVFVHALSILSDNYVYIITWSDHALVIDPGDSAPVEQFLEERGLTLHGVLNTHHHPDHVDGNCTLKKKYDCPIIGPDDEKIPCLDQKVGEEELIIGPLGLEVIQTPGHTDHHICFYIPQFTLLFSGDTLFGGGCGRLFEGTAKDLYESLQKIAALPDETLIFCGHEYTLKNLEFALTVEPQNEELQKRYEKVKEMRSQNKPTIPLTLLEEKRTNPFLRTHMQSIRQNIQMENATEVEVLARLREMRNQA